MAKSTVYSFAKYLMGNEEFNLGGCAEKEANYIGAIGMSAEDEEAFFKAMWTIYRLNRKYKKDA